MKKAFLLAMIICAVSCTKSENYKVDSEYEMANITGLQVYNRQGDRADSVIDINLESSFGKIIIKSQEDITNLKIVATISTGAEIYPSMSVGYQDFSEPKSYTVRSPGGTISKKWVIDIGKIK